MARLSLRTEGANSTSALQVPKDRISRPDGRPRRTVSLMRKYEAAALTERGDLQFEQIVAPASRMFEEATAAFARGALVTTPNGPVAIEDLLPGDMVETPDGPKQITWIGSTIFYPQAAQGDSTLSSLTRVTAEAFGMARPMSDLLIGPGARMVLKKESLRELLGTRAVLAPIQDYSDGDRIFEVTPPSPVQMYNLALAEHNTIYVGGMEVESYHPGKTQDPSFGETLRALFLSLFPHTKGLDAFGALIYPRTSRKVLDGLNLG